MNNKLPFIIGVSVFVVNLTENIIHYNIGRNNELPKNKLYMPNIKELTVMTITSLVASVVISSLVLHFKK